MESVPLARRDGGKISKTIAYVHATLTEAPTHIVGTLLNSLGLTLACDLSTITCAMNSCEKPPPPQPRDDGGPQVHHCFLLIHAPEMDPSFRSYPSRGSSHSFL